MDDHMEIAIKKTNNGQISWISVNQKLNKWVIYAEKIIKIFFRKKKRKTKVNEFNAQKY